MATRDGNLVCAAVLPVVKCNARADSTLTTGRSTPSLELTRVQRAVSHRRNHAKSLSVRLRRCLLIIFMLLCFMVTNSAANGSTRGAVMTSDVTRRSADDSALDAALGIRRMGDRYQRDRDGAAQNNRFHLKFPFTDVSVEKSIRRRLVPLDA